MKPSFVAIGIIIALIVIVLLGSSIGLIDIRL